MGDRGKQADGQPVHLPTVLHPLLVGQDRLPDASESGKQPRAPGFLFLSKSEIATLEKGSHVEGILLPPSKWVRFAKCPSAP